MRQLIMNVEPKFQSFYALDFFEYDIKLEDNILRLDFKSLDWNNKIKLLMIFV